VLRRLAFFGLCGTWFGVGPLLEGLPFAVSSVALVALGVALACAASERVHYLAIATGSMGAFGCVTLAGSAPALAGAWLIGLAFAERSSRIRVSGARLAHVGLGLLGGALAFLLAEHFRAASPAISLVSIIVAVALASLPLLLVADDPIAHSLELAAARLPGATKSLLHEAAELRRHTLETELDADTEATVKGSWEALLRLATAKLRLEGSTQRGPSTALVTVQGIVDTRLSDHLSALRKAFSAADTIKALTTTASDTALHSVAEKSDSMDEVSRLMLEYEIDAEPAKHKEAP
jgi:hypothetical protein